MDEMPVRAAITEPPVVAPPPLVNGHPLPQGPPASGVWRPIADYALLSDCQSAALVGRGGAVDWLCFPHFDSGSVFARLLDPGAGHWSLTPRGVRSVERHYMGTTMVLRTEFRTRNGAVVLTDALALGPGDRGGDLGRRAPHVLLRVLECTRGTAEVAVEFAPRPEYGLARPLLTPLDGGRGLVCGGGPGVLVLSTPVPLRGTGVAKGLLRLRAGQRAGFALRYVPTGDDTRPWTGGRIDAALDATLRSWGSWAALNQRYRGPWEQLVHHSGRVLQALTYAPTGAIVAAPTTSLPEVVGGGRNWDYRFSWVRDTSFTLHALSVAACPGEAEAFFSWMAEAAAAGGVVDGDPLQIMYGIRGERELTERTLDHLGGWRGSRPVRVGNDAWRQRQLDIYGELLDAALLLRDQLRGLDGFGKRFLTSLACAAAAHWREPDHSIWEIRNRPRHFLYSKLMCWVALDRALVLADDLDAAAHVHDWRRARDEIRTAIEEHGWSERAGAYTQSFGSDALDASALMLPIVGFAPPDDPRMRATVEAVRDGLTGPNGLLYRYRCGDADDGLTGEEGTFVLCTFWLAHALALMGEVAAAREVFERAAGYANDVGLLAEEVDPAGGQLLGNFPQAFSHIGLVNTALALFGEDGAG